MHIHVPPTLNHIPLNPSQTHNITSTPSHIPPPQSQIPLTPSQTHIRNQTYTPPALSQTQTQIQLSSGLSQWTSTPRRNFETSLTSTWDICSKALYEDQIHFPSADTIRSFPAPPSSKVLKSIQEFIQPDVQAYLKLVVDHFKRGTNDVNDSQNSNFTDIMDIDYTNMDEQSENNITEHTHGSITVEEKFEMPEADVAKSPRQTPRRKLPTLNMSSEEDDKLPAINIQPALRRSPRKRLSMIPAEGSPLASGGMKVPVKVPESSQSSVYQKEVNFSTATDSYEKTKLMDYSDIVVDKEPLKKAVQLSRRASNPGYALCLKLLPLLFTISEMGNSRGQGLKKSKEHDIRPALDKDKIKVMKEYVKAWCVQNKFDIPSEQKLNDGITEKVQHCRKVLKKKTGTN